MRPRLSLILCGLLVAVSAPVVAQAAEPPAPGGAPSESKPTEPAPKTEPPASSTPPAPEGTSGDVEAEEEQESREAEALLAAEEAAALRRIEHEGTATSGNDETLGGSALASLRCVVPSLKGDTLATARRTLSRDHCRLGRITRPRTRHAALIVTRQARPAGDRLSDGAAVAVRLGARRRRR